MASFLVAPRPLLIVANTRDIWPIQGTKEVFQDPAFYRLLKADDRIGMIVSKKGHTYEGAEIERVARWFNRWLGRSACCPGRRWIGPAFRQRMNARSSKADPFMEKAGRSRGRSSSRICVRGRNPGGKKQAESQQLVEAVRLGRMRAGSMGKNSTANESGALEGKRDYFRSRSRKLCCRDPDSAPNPGGHDSFWTKSGG